MVNHRVRMERDLLQGTAGVLRRHERQMEQVQTRLARLDFRLEPDDPIQVHPRFLKSFRAFRDTWRSEIDVAGTATVEVANRLARTAKGLKDTDTSNSNRTPQGRR